MNVGCDEYRSRQWNRRFVHYGSHVDSVPEASGDPGGSAVFDVVGALAAVDASGPLGGEALGVFARFGGLAGWSGR
ncbi:hypothetical protein MINT15_37380 [Saccharomonospora viridis]|uniref:Uncharacterized protein n=1 Tax=Saccharomonospora viridis TaxID=1852 RepID=A0A837DCK4_9PSEU|nr:hypothetical protein MINT15_37380 [Saccharomonospora viridis]